MPGVIPTPVVAAAMRAGIRMLVVAEGMREAIPILAAGEMRGEIRMRAGAAVTAAAETRGAAPQPTERVQATQALTIKTAAGDAETEGTSTASRTTARWWPLGTFRKISAS